MWHMLSTVFFSQVPVLGSRPTVLSRQSWTTNPWIPIPVIGDTTNIKSVSTSYSTIYNSVWLGIFRYLVFEEKCSSWLRCYNILNCYIVDLILVWKSKSLRTRRSSYFKWIIHCPSHTHTPNTQTHTHIPGKVFTLEDTCTHTSRLESRGNEFCEVTEG